MEQISFLEPNTGAVFSPCRRYRYALWRIWNESKPPAMFVGLNPSTADEVNNDNTVSSCIRYARDWGYGSLVMTNIFAYRARYPKDMKAQEDPVGPENDRHLLELAGKAGVVVAVWGNDGRYRGRSAEVRRLIPRLHCLVMTKAGEPHHPLYLPTTLKPIPMEDGPH